MKLKTNECMNLTVICQQRKKKIERNNNSYTYIRTAYIII